MSRKDKWVEEALESIDSVEKTRMSDAITMRILNRLKSAKGKVVSVRPAALWRTAAVLALLIGLNIFSIAHFGNMPRVSESKKTNAFTQEYFSYVNQSISF